jgi:hypothetical protein
MFTYCKHKGQSCQYSGIWQGTDVAKKDEGFGKGSLAKPRVLRLLSQN